MKFASPGYWTISEWIREYKNRNIYVDDENGVCVAKIAGGAKITTDTMYANARLIAAAPQMLEALRFLNTMYGSSVPWIKELIKKASED